MNFLFLNLPGLKVGVFIDDDLQFKSVLKIPVETPFSEK
jgi:hypothetical protein